ncbi:hypothetical protein MMSR116_24495 [Methylobacterium mesophilicum SR1.6/6]|uniref:Uncharacterized protein n=1 Tax=Methylobacterium mesophilicum SR1.6/6 TaxID=908290 RepID=A0A6B9FQM2_9HYPH|nr:hypothetical protein [Methylobacterium mesophilicum]QGY04707.1 hypothetical protein MMSR116_24495 [Methylobacterium mesophilicum SR1.6/6]
MTRARLADAASASTQARTDRRADRPDAAARGRDVRRRALLAGLLLCALPHATARAEPAVRILDLPFKVRALRGPRSEAAVSVATSGLLPITGATVSQQPGDEESAPLAVAWGDAGGAVLALSSGTVTVRPIGPEAVEGLTAAETPRGALPGSRRALSGPISAYLTGRTRAADGSEAASVLTIRERQPMAVSTDPKPVPVATVTVPAGGEAVFAPLRPRLLRLGDRPALLATTRSGADSGGLVLIGRPAGGTWAVTARTDPQPGPPLKIAGIADFAGSGQIQAATVSARGRLQIWTLQPDRIEPAGAAEGYAAGDGDSDLAVTAPAGGSPELILPVAGKPEIALITVKGAPRERLRVPLPAAPETGIVVLGEGAAARIVVGLADGRVAVVAPEGGTP